MDLEPDALFRRAEQARRTSQATVRAMRAREAWAPRRPFVRVSLRFASAASRADVVELLEELGPWAGGELVVEPTGDACFELPGGDVRMADLAVRARLALALSQLGGAEPIVDVQAALVVPSAGALVGA